MERVGEYAIGNAKWMTMRGKRMSKDSVERHVLTRTKLVSCSQVFASRLSEPRGGLRCQFSLKLSDPCCRSRRVDLVMARMNAATALAN